MGPAPGDGAPRQSRNDVERDRHQVYQRTGPINNVAFRVGFVANRFVDVPDERSKNKTMQSFVHFPAHAHARMTHGIVSYANARARTPPKQFSKHFAMLCNSTRTHTWNACASYNVIYRLKARTVRAHSTGMNSERALCPAAATAAEHQHQ